MCSEFTTTLSFDPGYTNPPFGLENESGLLRFVEACMSQGKTKLTQEQFHHVLSIIKVQNQSDTGKMPEAYN
jgi:hypothetical protein